MTIEELEIVIEAQTKQFQNEISNVTKQVSAMEKHVNKSLGNIKNVFGKVGKWIAAIQIGKAIKDSIIAAMNSIESDSMFDTVFGGLANDVRQWSEELQNTLGLNGYALRENVATLFNMTRSMGLAANEAVNLSKEMTLLAEDMASFYNLSSSEAFNKIRAGLTGETEPLKQLGILVDEATIKQYAYANGIAVAGTELNNVQKVMARYGAIAQQAGTASGDLARTLNSPSNQARILKNNLNLLMIELGRAFMPIVQVVLPLLNSLVRGLTIAANTVARFMNALFGTKNNSDASNTAQSISDVNTSLAGTSEAYDNAGASAKKAAKEAKKFLAGFDEINTIKMADDTDSEGGSGGGVSGGGMDIPDFDLSGQEGVLNEFTGRVEEFALKIRGKLAQIADFVREHKEIIVSIVGGLVAGIIAFFVASNWTTILATITSVIGWIQAIPTALGLAGLAMTSPAALIAGAIGLVTTAFLYLWQTSDSFKQALIEGWNALVSALKPYFDAIKNALFLIGDILTTFLKPIIKVLWDFILVVVDNIVKILMSFWTNCIAPLIQFLGECLKKVIEGLQEIWAAWKPTFEKIMEVVMWVWETCLKPLINWIGTVFIDAFKNIGDTIKPILDSLKTMFNGLIDFIVGVFTGNWRKAWQGVQNIFRGIFNGLVNIAKAPINLIIGAINTMIRGLNKIKLPDWVPGLGGKGISIPEIPKLAKGGIVDGATLAMVGEDGKEAVMPLERNTGWITQLANQLTDRLPNQGSTNDTPLEIVLQVGTTEFGRVVINSINKLQRQSGTNLIKI